MTYPRGGRNQFTISYGTLEPFTSFVPCRNLPLEQHLGEG